MKKLSIYFIVSLLLSFGIANAQEVNEKEITLSEDQIKQLSESYGYLIMLQLQKLPIDLDTDLMIKGIKGSVAKEKPPMDLNIAIRALMSLEQQSLKNQAASNLKEANDFLEKNKNNKEIVVLEDGKVQYQILTPGSGDEVKEDSNPRINYEGKFLNGDIFDSSERRGGPQTMPLNRTIAGFRKGIVGMKEGEKRLIYIHPDLGYGMKKTIQPNALLIFEIEVIKANYQEEPSED